MKTLKSLVAVIGFCSLIACSNSQKESSQMPTIKIPDSFEAGEFSLSEIISDINFIPLSSETPLPSITQISCFDSVLYLKTQGASKLYRFRLDGTYIDALDKKGQGPGEYMSISDFHVDKAGTIYVNCGTNKRILVYSSELTYKTTIPYPQELGRSMVRWLDSIFIFFPNEVGEVLKYDWVTTNYRGEIVDVKTDPYAGRIRSYGPSNSFMAYEKDGVIYRYRNWSDTIFGISGNGASAKYVYSREFADGLRMSSLDEILLEDMSIEKITEATKRAGKRNINAINDLGDKLIIKYVGEKSEYVLFDPITNKSKIILDNDKGFAPLPNNWFGSGMLNITAILKIGNDRFIVGYIEAYNLKMFGQSNEFINSEHLFPERKGELLSIVAQLNENDNPVLFLFKIK